MKIRSRQVIRAAKQMAKVMASNDANAWENLAALRFLLKYGESALKGSESAATKKSLWWMGYKSGMLALSVMDKFPRVISIPTKWRVLLDMNRYTEDRVIKEIGEEWPSGKGEDDE